MPSANAGVTQAECTGVPWAGVLLVIRQSMRELAMAANPGMADGEIFGQCWRGVGNFTAS